MNPAGLIERFRQRPLWQQMVLSGAVTALSFPPLPLGFLAWVGLVPLLLAWERTGRPGQVALLAWQWSLGYLFVMLYWLMFNTGTHFWAATAAMIGTVLLVSLNFLAIGWWYGWLKARWGKTAIWLLPVVWVSVEYLRTYGSIGFPWVALANSQTGFLLLMQNAELTGIYGLSFWVVLINILVVELLHAGDRQKAGLALGAALVAPWITGALLLPPATAGSYKVGLVQPNVEAAEKWNSKNRNAIFAQLDEMTRIVAADSPAVVFWPEAATPAYLLKRSGRRYMEDIQGLVSDIGIPVVTGLPHYERQSSERVLYYNSIAHIDSAGLVKLYHKTLLVPFAEMVPAVFKWLRIIDLLGVNLGEFSPGSEYTVFEIGEGRFSVGICLETIYPRVYRRFTLAGANFLVGAVNDGWYDNGLLTEPYQHAAQLRFRAIENRRPVVRVGNTGISMLIDKGGRVTGRLGLNVAGTLTGQIAPSDEVTFYTRFGDVFAWLNLIIGITFSGIPIWRSRKTVLKDQAE